MKSVEENIGQELDAWMEQISNRKCIWCGHTESEADRSAQPDDLCPINPGCEYPIID